MRQDIAGARRLLQESRHKYGQASDIIPKPLDAFPSCDHKPTRSIIEVHLANRIHNLTNGDIGTFKELAAMATLNGRQIRNVISSAEAMVDRRKSKRFTYSDIRSVLYHTKQSQALLQDYSKQLRGNNEALSRMRGEGVDQLSVCYQTLSMLSPHAVFLLDVSAVLSISATFF